ncbi:MAG TPA: hypothetical protein PK867_28885, partial [Pirellulales bacterium]|nr:hypothetical protein [Pirellulales bacterium]
MNPAEFIVLAGRIVTFGPAGARTAVSRSYYGAFHEALDLLDDIGCGCPRNGKAHNLVPIFLDFPGISDARRASGLLSDLHSDRVKCDYRLRELSVEDTAFAKLDVETSIKITDLLKKFQLECQSAPMLQAFQSHVARI